MNVSTSTLSHIAGLGVVPIMPPDILAGRLAYHIQNWVRITRDRWVLHRIPDHTLPNKEATHPTLQRNPELEPAEVGELLQKGAVAEVTGDSSTQPCS